MRLTAFSDYAFRVLMYAAAADDRLVTIEETARIYGISRAHLMKVVNTLVKSGYLRGVRGRSGGFALARPLAEISLGEFVRATEPDFALVECLAAEDRCLVSDCCKLPAILNEALDCFLATLDRYTMADIALTRRNFDMAALSTATTGK